MTRNNNRNIQWLLNELQDPFVMFPFQSVAQTLNKALENSEELFTDRMGPNGVARKFWDVPTELIHTEIGLLIGTAFVLGQVTISQTVAIYRKLRQEADNLSSLPFKKEAILRFEAQVTFCSGFSEIEIIDSVANYFKHHHEWTSDWNISKAHRSQIRTIEIAKCVGMSPINDLTENLRCGLIYLDIWLADILLMAEKIQSWREKLACRLCDFFECSE